jgi:hypothetical protein
MGEQVLVIDWADLEPAPAGMVTVVTVVMVVEVSQ